MSTFEGLINEIEGISVDQFERQNLTSRVYFLSHCHSDHMVGINSPLLLNHLKNHNYSIYASEISSVILKNKYPGLRNYVKALSIGETHTILVPKSQNCEDHFISVTLIPAGHCPGSVMFLFKTVESATVLYTGDFRIYPKDLPKMKQLQDRNGATMSIDKMYFDSTFWNEAYPEFPSRNDSCSTICDVIREWIYLGPEYNVNLSIPAYYGSEFLYKDIADTLKMPIHVHENVYASYRQIAEMEKVFTHIAEATQIHSCSSIKGCNTRPLMCRNTKGLIIRHIRPSARKWSMMKNDNTMPIFSEDAKGFSVCYSSHCSFNELKAFIEYLKPKSIEPCVVPTKYIKCTHSAERIREKFYESINSFCTRFLKVSCRISDKETLNTCTENIDIEPLLCPDESSRLENNIKMMYPDSEEEEPPQKSSRLMMIHKSKMFANTN